MSTAATEPGPGLDVDPRAVRRKVARRLLPLIFVLYIISYLDRVNVGFAKERMQASLNFSDRAFGWAAGIFFAGYLLLEIPGALLVERWSARKWFARILVTWGACSMAVAFVRSGWQFGVVRFLLGLAESGFFPGVIVYLTHWFPRAERGKAMAGLVLAVPVSLALGARVSGWLMQRHWLGLDGWQWVFLGEGLPAVLMGLAVPWLLTDRPRQARWLEPEEREWLESTLKAERQEVPAHGAGLGRALRSPAVWLLALGIFASNIGGYAAAFWLPTAVKSLLVATRKPAESTDVLNWLCVAYLFGLAGVWISGRSSDWFGDRKWHCVAGQVMAGVCLAASVAPGQSWAAVFAWLCAFEFFAFFWPPPFWVLPTLTLTASEAAVAVGIINIFANIAGLLGSPVIGEMKTRGSNDRACMLVLAACYAIGGLIVAALRVPREKRPLRDPSAL
ncbi:MAG TPA: MFS transporter [Isosphaeraceae bacterium]|jgi:ACS family tartrate transporter-like MFS transporter|nr:MFS transporter [Isosphaeraceae bacterium]